MSKLVNIPGIIDIHVHLRDPGQTHKEDFYTGTSAALAGGVTTVFDMPNNLAPIFTYEKLKEKMDIAKQKAVCDYGFFFGTDGENISEFEKVDDKVAGLKVYLNITTGKILIENESRVAKVFEAWPKNILIMVHAEGEKIDLAIKLAKRYGNRLHITHIASKSDLEKIIKAKKDKISVTCDVTPHHLMLFTRGENIFQLTRGREKKIYNLGNGFSVVKPALATREDLEYLWEHLEDTDCIATDHAPHTVSEKKSDDPPSGFPGLETILPLLLTAVKDKKLTVNDIIRLTNTNPQKIFGIKQDKDTYVEVDMDEKYTIENKNLKTKCGWSPFDGWEVYGKIKRVFIRGTKVFEAGKVLVSPGFGHNIL